MIKQPTHLLKATIVACAMFGFSALTTSAVASPNLVVNNSFETGDFTGWTVTGTTFFSGVSGNFGGINPTDGAFQGFFGEVGSTSTIAQDIATISSETYLVSFDLYNFGGAPNSVVANFGSNLLTLTDAGAFPYTHFEFWVNAAGALTSLDFTIRQDPSYYLLDNISVTQTPEPGTIALIGVALLSLLGFGVMRRRA